MQLAIETGEWDFLVWLVERGAFDNRSTVEVTGVLHMLAKQPRDFAPELADNQRVARAILERTRLQPDPAVRSLLATPAPHAR